MVNKPEMIGVRLTRDIKNLITQVAEEMGLTISEYVRSLILKDLEQRSIITTKIEKIKEEIRNG